MKKKEDVKNSIKSIISFIEKEDRNDIKKLMISDLKDKIDDIYNEQRNDSTKEKIDLIVFTVVPIEFTTFCKYFDIDNTETNRYYDINGLWFFRFELPRNKQTSLNCLVTMIGKAGGINASLACVRALNKFDPSMCILLGIAAGIKSKVKKYNAIIVEGIVDYEFQRIEENEIKYRLEPYNINRSESNYIKNLILKPNQKKWKKYLEKILNKESNKISLLKLIKSTEVVSGIIASGAKLLADGKTLQNMRKKIPIGKGIIGAEMEGNGFCPTCEEYGTKWISFRGVSDYGESDKNNQSNKKNQFLAVYSATAAFQHFFDSYCFNENEKEF